MSFLKLRHPGTIVVRQTMKTRLPFPISKADVSYPPLDVPKPIAKNLWNVDSGPLRVMGLIPLPVRMTIIRLADGGLLLHSPTRFDFDMARELEQIGPIRH